MLKWNLKASAAKGALRRRLAAVALGSTALVAMGVGLNAASDGRNGAAPLSQASAAAAPVRRSGAADRPNIIVVLSDDLGWADVGFHGSEIRTPTLDGLARKGVQLDRYYTYAVCSPTRAALMSGRSSLETGIDAPIALDASLAMDATLLPQHLKSRGYQTMMVGKWHLGQADVAFMPFNRGFDSYYGFLGGFIDHYTHLSPDGQLDWQRDGVSVREEGYSTDLFTREAISKIKSRDKAKPFFLYLTYDAPHTPLQAPEADVKSYANIQDPRRRTYAAMVTHFDSEFAKVLAAVEAEGITGDTLIVWASDNGGQIGAGSNNRPLRGGKGTSFEGGERVPAVAYWPGHIEGGRRIDQPVTVLDWFPTLLKVAGVSPPADGRLVGHDAMGALRGGAAPQAKMVIGNHNMGEGYYESAYEWPWKLMRAPETAFSSMPPGDAGAPEVVRPARISGPNTVQLFNVATDPNEREDVSAAHPDIVKALLTRLDAAPRAPKSLSEWAPGNRRIGANGPPGGGPPGGGPPGGGPRPGGPGGGLPGGGAFASYAVERGTPIAEAAKGAKTKAN